MVAEARVVVPAPQLGLLRAAAPACWWRSTLFAWSLEDDRLHFCALCPFGGPPGVGTDSSEIASSIFPQSLRYGVIDRETVMLLVVLSP